MLMAIGRRKEDGRIFVNYTEEGKRKRKYFSGPDSIAWAEAELFNKSKSKPRRNTSAASDPTFKELTYSYMMWFQPRTSIVEYNNMVAKMEGVVYPFLGDKPVSTISHGDIDRYIMQRIKKVVLNTVCRDLDYIRAVLNWSVRRKLINRSPLQSYDFPRRQHTKVNPLSQEQIEQVIYHAPDHAKRAVLLAYFLGLRPGAVELFTLRYSQVNWSAGTVTVIAANKGGAPKREIPIHPALPLKSWYMLDGEQSDKYIITWKGKPIRSMKTAWKTAKRNAGFDPKQQMRFYGLRHAFVTELLHKGVNPYTVAEMSGHSVQTMMKYYANTSSSAKTTAVEQLPTLNFDKPDETKKENT